MATAPKITTGTHPRKNSSSPSKDGKWRSFPKVPHLLQYVTSGTYYARVKVGGKPIRESLGTSVFSTAKARLVDSLNDKREAPSASDQPTFAGAVELYRAKAQADSSMKQSSKDYRELCISKIQRSWPEFWRLHLADISPESCRKWAARLRADIASQYFNNVIGTLRLIINKSR